MTGSLTSVMQIRNQLAREGFRDIGKALDAVGVTSRLRSLMLNRRRDIDR